MDYWKNTWKENFYLGEAHRNREEQEWLRARNIQFEIALSGAGKARKSSLKRPSDLYPVTKEERQKSAPLEGAAGEAALKALFS